jgi:membrane-associated phospholipid phosphatase
MSRLVICILLLLATRAGAHAEPRDSLDLSYFYDDGAVPFFWAPLGLGVAVHTLISPREIPFGFTDEGGEAAGAWEIPGWAIVGLGVTTGAGMLASGEDSRYYHVKGLSQSMATSMFATAIGKSLIGRRRPDWSEDLTTWDSRRSFPSGHATQAFAVATYSILFLRGHVLGDEDASWEAAAYGGIAFGATLLSAERVLHKRHHLADVVVGGIIGTTTSLVFYRFQQRRFESDLEGMPARRGAPVLGWSMVW